MGLKLEHVRYLYGTDTELLAKPKVKWSEFVLTLPHMSPEKRKMRRYRRKKIFRTTDTGRYFPLPAIQI